MNTVTLIGEGRLNLTWFVYQMCEINSKIFLVDILFWLEGAGGGVRFG